MSLTQRATPIVIAALFGCVALFQYAYDRDATADYASVPPLPPAQLIKLSDFGLHAAVAGFLWTSRVMTELPFLPYGFGTYSDDLKTVNGLDPRLSIPYYWSVLILPDAKSPERIDAAVAIGERGMALADPDWRLAFYLAMDEALYKEDYAKAAMYFDAASRMPGIPQAQREFSENYGLIPKTRASARAMWALLYQTSGDETTRDRALLHIERFNDLDVLEYAARLYKQSYGAFPKTVQDMVNKNILRAVPQDPFGFAFVIDQNGTASVKTN